jgi:hypothetical protein
MDMLPLKQIFWQILANHYFPRQRKVLVKNNNLLMLLKYLVIT